jgi:glycine cleavage system transcriptional repressor
MPSRWIVTALGQDRPGIVAGVTQVLYKLGCNLEDSAMTRLGGEFAIMLVFSSPAKVTLPQIEKAFQVASRRLKLTVHLKALSAKEAMAPRVRPGVSYQISVYGTDKPGIVYRVAEALARLKVNITDVHTHRSSTGKPYLYLTLLEVVIPPKLTAETLEQQLKRVGQRLGVEVHLRPVETEVL